MTLEHVPGTDHTKSGGPVGALADLPASFPSWARQLAELYFSGTTSAFVLHGNTYDFVRSPGRDKDEFVGLAEFLAEQLFGRWSLVLHYDLGRGLRAFGVSWFNLFQFPDLVGKDEHLYHLMHDTHHLLFKVLVAVALLHAAGALKHHFIDRNNVLRRMLPFSRIE